ncbi:MAG: hypothetical protein GY796_28345 [Chloroflexi bacterium]|nr:hypothetical protein [Chloroflexota bacterium]
MEPELTEELSCHIIIEGCATLTADNSIKSLEQERDELLISILELLQISNIWNDCIMNQSRLQNPHLELSSQGILYLVSGVFIFTLQDVAIKSINGSYPIFGTQT